MGPVNRLGHALTETNQRVATRDVGAFVDQDVAELIAIE